MLPNDEMNPLIAAVIEATEEAATRLQSIIEEHGAEAILPYSYAGTMGVVQRGSLDQRLFSRLGATNLERTICGNTACHIKRPVPDL